MVTCPFCNIELRDKFNLKKHIKSNHTCKFCSKDFSTKSILKNHMKVCLEKPKLDRKCRHCGKEFTHKGHFEEHEKICGLHKLVKQKYECYLCFPNRIFANNTNLVNHVRTHEQEKFFKCEQCPKSFSTQTSLTQHENLHNRFFWCNTCNKKFTTKQGLRKHEGTIHKTGGMLNNIEPKCSYCGKKYSSMDNLNKHVKKKHTQLKNVAQLMVAKKTLKQAMISCDGFRKGLIEVIINGWNPEFHLDLLEEMIEAMDNFIKYSLDVLALYDDDFGEDGEKDIDNNYKAMEENRKIVNEFKAYRTRFNNDENDEVLPIEKADKIWLK